MASFFHCFPRSLLSFSKPETLSDADAQRYPEWLSNIIDYHEKAPQQLHPTVEALKQVIEKNPRVKLLVSGMLDEVAASQEGKKPDPKKIVLNSYFDLCWILNHMLRVPPLWNTYMFMLGAEATPVCLLLRTGAQTICGFSLFQDPDVNTCLKNILNEWGKYLVSTDSRVCLDTSSTGWFCPSSLKELVAAADDGDTNKKFEDIYECDSSAPYYGFGSWDDFFTRKFRAGVRPVASPDDDSVITNACESLPWRIARNVKYEDHFWAKGGPFSLRDMLACDELSGQFAGGTVYQAYLNALAYHRWHSPVTGMVRKILKVPGFYFSEPSNYGFGGNSNQIDPNDSNWEQSYLAATATRAVMFIESDNKDIGLMAVITIGMAEVSSCEFHALEGQRVTKGQEIGMFHYGGSTHCVVFRGGVELEGFPKPGSSKKNSAVNSELCRVVKKKTTSVRYMDEPPVYADL